jgi:hypothetical protein
MTGPAYVPGSSVASTTLPLTNKTGTYVIDNTDCVINCTSNTFTVTLPTAVGLEGKYFIIKNRGSGVITVDADGSETIDGLANKLLAIQNESITVISDGSNWIIV